MELSYLGENKFANDLFGNVLDQEGWFKNSILEIGDIKTAWIVRNPEFETCAERFIIFNELKAKEVSEPLVSF